MVLSIGAISNIHNGAISKEGGGQGLRGVGWGTEKCIATRMAKNLMSYSCI